MIKDYSLFYSYKDYGDILFINIRENIGDIKEEVFDDIHVKSDKLGLFCVEIHHLNKILKIRFSGFIFLPNEPLIDAINSILDRYHIEKLAYVDTSLYYVGNVIKIENDKVYVDINSETLICPLEEDININDLVCVAKYNALLKDGTRLKIKNKYNGKICYEDDVYLSDEHIIIKLDKNELVGQDFLKLEAI